MNVAGCVHHLEAETVLIQGDALNLLTLRGHHRYSLILLREFFGGLGQSPRQTPTGGTHRLNQGFNRSSASNRGKIRTDAPSLSLDHVTTRAIGIAIEKLFPMRGVAERLRGRFHLNAAKICDDLPDFFVGHSDTLAVSAVARHDGSRDPLTDVAEHVSVGIAVTLVGARQIGTASSAASAKAMAQRAVDPEFEFT